MKIKKSKDGFLYILLKELKKKDRIAFTKWLAGQTRPVVEEEKDEAWDCAFYEDYFRWRNNKPIVD